MNGCAEQFAKIFRHPPTVIARAPGRINLIGEHVDYQDGLVLPAAIDRYVVAAAAPIRQNEVRIWSILHKGAAPLSFPLENLARVAGLNSWANYVLGVVAAYREAGHPMGGFEAAFNSNLPIGAGLSSSAALESATALLVESLTGIEKSPKDRALLCQKAEHTYAGVPCGIMDQMAANAGIRNHALMLDCRSLEITPTKIPDGISIVIAESGVKHALADGEYAKRRSDCESAAQILGVPTLRDLSIDSVSLTKAKLGDRLYHRARHVVSEIERVRQFSVALEKNQFEIAGEWMDASHASLRDDFEVSCPELDTLVEIAHSLGAIGARMMGGGFGGSIIALVPEDEAKTFVKEIAHSYQKATGSKTDAFTVQPVDGAAPIFS